MPGGDVFPQHAAQIEGPVVAGHLQRLVEPLSEGDAVLIEGTARSAATLALTTQEPGHAVVAGGQRLVDLVGVSLLGKGSQLVLERRALLDHQRQPLRQGRRVPRQPCRRCRPATRRRATAPRTAAPARAKAAGVLADRTSSTAGGAGGVSVVVGRGASSRTTCALVPPKPKELTPARRGRAEGSQGVSCTGTCSGRLQSMWGLGRWKCRCGGRTCVGQGQADLDQAGDAGRAFQMSDVGFHGADVQGALRIASGSEHGAECAHFDGVTQGGAGPVGFHVVDIQGRELGIGQGLADDGLLGQSVGGGQPVAASVLIDGRAAEQAEDGIAVGLGVGQSLEQHDATPFAAHKPIRLGRERLTATRRRQHPRLVERRGRIGRHDQTHTAG